MLKANQMRVGDTEVIDQAWYKSKAKEIIDELDQAWNIACPRPNILPSYKALMSILGFAKYIPFKF